MTNHLSAFAASSVHFQHEEDHHDRCELDHHRPSHGQGRAEAFVEVGALLENSPYAFDFEFVPAVIANLVWSADGPQPPGTRDHFLRTVAASMKRLDPDDVD